MVGYVSCCVSVAITTFIIDISFLSIYEVAPGQFETEAIMFVNVVLCKSCKIFLYMQLF